MRVNFNRLRIQTMEAYNILVEAMNYYIEEPFPEEVNHALLSLRAGISAIAYTNEEENDEFKNVGDEVEFKELFGWEEEIKMTDEYKRGAEEAITYIDSSLTSRFRDIAIKKNNAKLTKEVEMLQKEMDIYLSIDSLLYEAREYFKREKKE